MDKADSAAARSGRDDLGGRKESMNRRFTPAGLASKFEKLAATADVKLAVIAGAIGDNTEAHIKGIFGNLDRLKPLQPETIAEKAAHGAERPEAPLIDTGALRDSIEHAVRPVPGGVLMGVGSDDPKMLWHELGTSRGLPPRPAIMEGCMDASESNIELFALGASSLVADEPPVELIQAKLRARTVKV